MTRKANGEGSIYQDRDGRWHAKVWMGVKTDGTPDRRHVTGKKRALVAAKKKELERQRDQGLFDPAGSTPQLQSWLEHWLDNIAINRVRPLTLEGYRSLVRLHLGPRLGKHRLDRLKPEHLESAYKGMVEGGLSPATVLRAHRMLSRALKVAVQRGKVVRNVAALVEPPTVKRSQSAAPLTADEAQRVLRAAQGERNAARWTVALAVGLRQSEALGLQWRDIDLKAGSLSVQRGLHRVKGQGLVYEEPKADRSRRTLALPRQLVDALKEHRTAQDAERVAAGSLWEQHDLVFAQVNGRPIDKKADWKAWKALLAKAEVRDVRLHDGRHTAATLLLSAGVHPRVVMELLGHAQMRTTTDTYSHVLPALAREAADTMGTALWGPTTRTVPRTGPGTTLDP